MVFQISYFRLQHEKKVSASFGQRTGGCRDLNSAPATVNISFAVPRK